MEDDLRALSPVEDRNGRWYKREDLYRHSTGVNGAKWRQCQWLIQRARAESDIAMLWIVGGPVAA